MKFADIEDAFMFVSYGMYGDHAAMICRSTGRICWSSESGDMDEIPEEAYESDDWVEVPHKNDLNLGRDLVLESAAQRFPAEQGRIRAIFSRRGAYASPLAPTNDRAHAPRLKAAAVHDMAALIYAAPVWS